MHSSLAVDRSRRKRTFGPLVFKNDNVGEPNCSIQTKRVIGRFTVTHEKFKVNVPLTTLTLPEDEAVCLTTDQKSIPPKSPPRTIRSISSSLVGSDSSDDEGLGTSPTDNALLSGKFWANSNVVSVDDGYDTTSRPSTTTSSPTRSHFSSSLPPSHWDKFSVGHRNLELDRKSQSRSEPTSPHFRRKLVNARRSKSEVHHTCHGPKVRFGFVDPGEQLASVFEAARRSVAERMASIHFNKGLQFQFGNKTTKKDTRAAIAHYECAIELTEHTKSMVNAAQIFLMEGSKHTNPSRGLALLKRAAEIGDVRALTHYGTMLCYGDVRLGIRKDAFHGVQLLKQSIKFNPREGNALLQLSQCYLTGDGVDRVDLIKAFSLCSAAARCGLPVAQYNVGRMLTIGEGCSVDLDEAVNWYTRAAELGHLGAAHNLTIILETLTLNNTI